MIKINLEFLSWISQTIEVDVPGNSLHRALKAEDGCTIKTLLHQTAAGHPRFEQLVFDIKLQKLNEKVCVLHNGRQVELENGLETRLKDGDSLVLVPFLEGG